MHVKTKVATNGVANILALFSLSKSKPSLAKRKTIQLCLVAIAFIAISTLLNHRFYYIADPLVYTNDALDSDQSVKESPWNNLGLSNPAVPEGRAKSNADSSDSASQVHEQKVPASPIPKPSSLRTSQSAESDNPACARFFSRMTAPGTHFLNSSGTCESAGAQTVPQRIFFVHYNKQLENPRYLCAAESAARQNPAHSVTIYVKHRDQFEASVATWRRALGPDISGRVATEELDYADAFSETPLQTWWANRTYEKSSWVEQNLGNAFRLSKMWKDGGVYLDMDIISLNPVGAMGRSIAMQDSKRMNNAYFSLQRHDPFMMTLMTEFTSTFNGFAWFVVVRMLSSFLTNISGGTTGHKWLRGRMIRLAITWTNKIILDAMN
ncbi:Lactosylceramide 4-alpha-galactosyltransferase [Entophlyctis luteolus]|nr:Lactosylceramide 4-alpha-galactosyltransferase [Entophlyctis luteolus]